MLYVGSGLLSKWDELDSIGEARMGGEGPGWDSRSAVTVEQDNRHLAFDRINKVIASWQCAGNNAPAEIGGFGDMRYLIDTQVAYNDKVVTYIIGFDVPKSEPSAASTSSQHVVRLIHTCQICDGQIVRETWRY